MIRMEGSFGSNLWSGILCDDHSWPAFLKAAIIRNHKNDHGHKMKHDRSSASVTDPPLVKSTYETKYIAPNKDKLPKRKDYTHLIERQQTSLKYCTLFEEGAGGFIASICLLEETAVRRV